MYALCLSYGCDARINLKTYGPKCGTGRGRYGRPGMRPQEWRLNSLWVSGVKGWIFCGKYHRANHSHSRKEPNKAVQILNDKHPKSLTPVLDMAYVTSRLQSDSSTSNDEEVTTQWPQEDDEESDCSHIAYIAIDDLREIYCSLSNSSFIHGITEGGTRGYISTAIHADHTGTSH